MGLDTNQRYVVGEFVEDYQAKRLGRRELLQHAVFVMGGIVGAAHALRRLGLDAPAVSAAPVIATVATAALRAADTEEPGGRTLPPPDVTQDPVVAPDDPEILATMVTFPGAAGTMFGYLARPAADGAFPALIVNHDNVGAAEPNFDIARRYAKEGYVALVVDLVSRFGGTAAVAASGANLLRTIAGLSDDDRAADVTAGVDYLMAQAFVDAAVGLGVTGFCYGGNQTFLLAVRHPAIRAAVPYYGMVDAGTLGQTGAAILALYGEDDRQVTPQAPAVEAALQAADKPHEIVIYPGAGHAFFFNFDMRYRPEVARDAWRRTLAWFTQYLSA